jgi:hypothetical protein
LTVAAEDPLSHFTSALTDLLSAFGKLNTAVADKMKENERYLLARWMQNLSNGFYGLMYAKQDLTKAMEQSSEPGASINYSTYVPAVQRLQKEVDCVSAQLKDKGARIGALGPLSDIDGISIERKLRAGLEEKVSDLKKVVADMGIEPSGSDGLALKATIEADGEKARQAAERLYQMTSDFARVLDPTVIAPEHPIPCVKPSAG